MKAKQDPWERATALLLQTPKSRREMEQKMARWEVPAEEIKAVCDRLEDVGLLDDREHAHRVVRHYAEKGFGPQKLREELYRRGVPREYWDEAMAEIEDREDSGVLDALLEKKLRGAEPSRENLKRASDYLARRGYGWSEISDAIERYRDNWRGEGEDP